MNLAIVVRPFATAGAYTKFGELCNCRGFQIEAFRFEQVN